jgi:glycosyltransferase involved in cell wall biosynthesis
VSVARNIGIKAAKYTWVAFLDGDDWWAPTFLEEIKKAIKMYPEHQLFASGRSRVFKDEVERYDHEFLPKDGTKAPVNYFEIISKFHPPINSSNVVIHKAIFERSGYFKEGQKKHEDHDLWIRMAVGAEVVFVNKNLSFYRKTEDNTASGAKFLAKDFCHYLSTIISVKTKITSEEKLYFKQYYNRYAVLVYLQYYGQFSKKENREVFHRLQQLLEGKWLRYAKMIKILPLKRLYPLYKKLKGA